MMMSRSASDVSDALSSDDDADNAEDDEAVVPVPPSGIDTGIDTGTGNNSADDDVMIVDGSPRSMCAPPAPTPSAVFNDEANLLGTVMTALWDDADERGMFRYDVRDVETRVVPGAGRYVAQLNEGRATKKRATEFRVDAVVQPFDAAKFNFCKAFASEVLFQFERATRGPVSGAVLGCMTGVAPTLHERVLCGPSPNLVVINVSPIEYGHVLLVPRVNDCIPQLADPATMELALHFAKEADSDSFRVGYNSLGAYATINHLHFQAYYLEHAFPVELAATAPLPQCPSLRGGARHHAPLVHLSRLVDYPVRGFVAELAPGVTPSRGIHALAELVGRACMALAAANVPHNVFVTKRGRRVFLYPQVFAERLSRGEVPADVVATGVNPACFEISGHMLYKSREDYAAADDAACTRILEAASVSEARFLQLADQLFGAPPLRVSATAKRAAVDDAGVTQPAKVHA